MVKTSPLTGTIDWAGPMRGQGRRHLAGEGQRQRSGRRRDSNRGAVTGAESYDRLVKRWGLAGLTVVLLAVLAFGLWWIASPRLAEGDRLGFALQVAVYGLLSGSVACWLGKSAGRGAERDAARRAAEALRNRRERLEAQLAARTAEREEIAARIAENPRLTGGPRP